MTRKTLIPFSVLLLALALGLSLGFGSASPAAAAKVDSFDAVLDHYEAMRLALAGDSVKGVSEHARRLQQAAADLQKGLTAEAAGVPAAKLPEVEALLPELTKAAGTLAAAKGLGAARDAFYELSKPLVRWRQAAGEGPEVAFCPMLKRSWLQPAGEKLGNPYYGSEMLRCGSIASK
jgi:hypothetical protein